MITVSRDALFSDRADTAEYKLKENQIFLASERMVGVGEGQNLSFHIFLLTISSLSRRRGSREFKQRRRALNGEVFTVEPSRARQ